jgi:RNA exonuclease 1
LKMASSIGKNKKYKLFASADGTVKPCAFFKTPEGCRMGENCKFSHSATRPGTFHTSNNLVVSSEESSESEGEMQRPNVETPTSQPKRKRADEKHSNVFAAPAASAESGSGKKFKYTDLLYDSPPEKAETLAPASVTTSVTSPPKQQQKKKEKKPQQKQPPKQQASNGPSFRNLNLPIASFSLPLAEPMKLEAKESPITEELPEVPAPSSKLCPKYIVPDSTQTGRKWKAVVAETQAHPCFAESFGMAKYKEDPLPGDLWIKAKPFGAWCADHPQAIAIDCEMCETKDPVSGRKNHNALCRISIVNAEDPEDVLLNTLVKPDWPVSDYRTWVNGIEKAHLESVQFTLRHAQAFMMALCSEETVIVGHALVNDLAALRMDHLCCVDSALLFKAKDCPTATVSLKDLALTILKKEMPEVHDSTNDARVALLCLDHYREQEGKVEEIVRTPSTKRRGSNGGVVLDGRNHHQLFVHRIPQNCQPMHIAKMLLEHSAVAPDSVNDIDFSSGAKGKAIVNFKSPRHAFLAFDTIKGTAETEKSGRLQKKVFLRDGDYVRIRKMAFEKGHKFSASSPANEN